MKKYLIPIGLFLLWVVLFINFIHTHTMTSFEKFSLIVVVLGLVYYIVFGDKIWR